MKMTQVYEIVNAAVKGTLGETAVVNQDLKNVVDIGNEIINQEAMDAYVKKLVNHIGKVIFDTRKYNGSVPSVLMDSWEFGSVLEKITAELPKATKNESWDLVDGTDYKQDIFYQPKVSAKFYNSQVTFEIPMSFTEKQIKQSFSNEAQLNGFITMLFNAVERAMTVQLDALIMSTINNMTAETLAQLDPGSGIVLTTGNAKAVNLLAEYNKMKGAPALTKDKALANPDFIKFANYKIKMYKDRFAKISTLFNIGGKDRFTPTEDLHIVLLSDFANASSVFLESDIIHKDLVAIPNYEVVPYWQGSGTDYSFDSVSKIDVIPPHYKKAVSVSGILGVMFDTQALGVCNLDKRVTSHYNAKGEFFNNFYKVDAGFFNDFNENFVVFYVA